MFTRVRSSESTFTSAWLTLTFPTFCQLPAGPRRNVGHYREKVSPQWEELLRRCREILQWEESLREVAEIVGAEGLQDADRLLMRTAETVRADFLQQNAYTEDAFSSPEKTLTTIERILKRHDRALERLKQGVSLEEAMRG